MYHRHSLLFLLSALAAQETWSFPNFKNVHLGGRGASSSSRLSFPSRERHTPPTKRSTSGNATGSSTDSSTTNSSNILWIIQDTFDSSNFFDEFGFYSGDDPTHGTVDYVNSSTAFANQLAYVDNSSKIIMKGDDTNWLPAGANRQSVRVSSHAQYNGGLFILDVNRAPWGCGVWPAFWTLGSGVWPYNGEIDIIEGVHDNEHNQVTWHTYPGCQLTPNANFTGTIGGPTNQPSLDCRGTDNGPGCSIIEWSRASYGPTFDAQGGGVFAMKWDQEGIAVWSFYRVAVPQDIVNGAPDPSQWGTPVANLAPGNCDPFQYFKDHSIIFDITFCGDWAGNSYATSGCPGTCSDRIMDPSNFVNASWDINTVKVYRRQDITGTISGSTRDQSVGLAATVGIATAAAISAIVPLLLL